MDVLKAEIARKKQQLEKTELLVPEKKYFKRSDLAAKLEEEYWKKCKRFKTDVEKGEFSAGSSDNLVVEKEHDETKQLARKEVVRRLRERGEPIVLFGETDPEAYARLKKLEMEQPEINKGFKNDFKAALDKVDEVYLNELLHSSGDNADGTSAKSVDVTVKETGLTIEEILEKAKGLNQGDRELDSEVVLNFLKLILKMWGDDLNSREDTEKRSFKGKMASAIHTQTVAYIKPLFRKLKKKELSADILECLVDIVKLMIERNYIKANDAYLEMAIGNAPWPIGVTMVGIHARTGREKIFARNVAHVLNDETQRKYIQAVKRLMTQSQKIFPTDPSRSVDYGNLA